MTTINNKGQGLLNTTGTGTYSGDTDPVYTGDVDCSSASVLRIPVSAAPSLSVTGRMALDDTVSGYPGLIKYYDGTQEMAILGLATADFSATDNYQISYNNALAKLAMTEQANGKLVNYVVATSTTNDSTTSVSFASSSLSASITPRSTSNTIYMITSCYANVGVNAGTQTEINFYMRLRRTSGTPTTISQGRTGKTNLTANSSPHSYRNVQLIGAETAPATTAQTYELQFGQLANTSLTCNIAGSTYPAFMILMEVAP
jgi:hypothetical protein